MAGSVLDSLVAEQVLAALQPGALELSLAAADDVLSERQALAENWNQRLERARFQAQRVARAEARRRDPQRPQPVPGVRRIRCRQHDLETILPGVAGAGDEPGAECRAEERLQLEHRGLLFRQEQ